MAEKLDGRKDYGLGENRPVENLDVQGPGKYYPDDYSAQISMYQRQNPLKASIPESFAKIITDIDDYAISAKALENETARQKQAELNRNDLRIQELNMKTDVSNQVYDEYRLLQSNLDEAKKKALAENKSVEGAYKEVLDDSRYVEGFNSPYASSMWSHIHNELSSEALREGRKTDTATTQYQMAANLSDAASDIRMRIMRGDIDIDEGMDRLSVAVYPYNNLPAELKDKMFREMFASFVLGRAEYLKVKMKPEDLVPALADLRDKYSKKDYYFLDNAGQRIKGENGEDLVYSVGLDYQVQAALTQAMISASNSRSAGNDPEAKLDTVNSLKQNFETATGIDTIRNNFVSDTARGLSDDQLSMSYLTYFNSLAHLGKPGAVRDALKDGSVLNVYKIFRAQAKLNPAAVPALIDKAIVQLESDLKNPQINFENYRLVVPHPGSKEGIQFESLAEACGNNLAVLGGDVYNCGRAYYQEMLSMFKKYRDFAAKSPANLLDALDDKYHQANENFAKSVSYSNILKGQGGNYTDNMEGQKLIYGSLSAVFETGASKVGATLPDSCMDQIFKNIADTAPNTQARDLAYVHLGAAMGKATRGGAALTNYYLKGHTDKTVQMALAGLLLSGDGQEQQLSAVSKMYALKENNNAQYDAKVKLLTEMHPNFSTDMEKWETKNKIPEVYRGVVDDVVFHLRLADYNQIEAQKAVAKNFVSIGSSMLNDAKVFVHTPAYQNWGADAKNIDKTMNSMINQVAGTFPNIKKQHPISFAVSDNGETFEVYMNGNKVSSTVFGQMAGNGLYLFNPMELGCSDNPKVASFVSANSAAAQLKGYIAHSFNGSMKDHMKQPGVTRSEADERKKIMGTAVFARDLREMRKMAEDRKNNKNTTLESYNGGALQCASSFASSVGHHIAHDVVVINGQSFGTPFAVQKVSDFAQGTKSVVKTGINNLTGNAKAVGSFAKDTYTAYDQNSPYSKMQRIQAASAKAAAKTVGKTVERGVNKIGREVKNLIKRHVGIYSTEEQVNNIYDEATFHAELEAKTSYANKINQDNISVPTSYAAQGIPEYADKYNASERNGYNVSGAYLPDVTNDESPTGFATSIFYVDSNSVPEGLGADYNYGREEVNEIVSATASAFGVDPKLIHAIIKHESGYQQRVRGGSGEYGYMQLMPATAKGLGVKEPLDGQQNIWGGTKLLAGNLRKYGSKEVALAAYNGGPKAAKAWLEGHPWSESVAYVKAVLGNLGETNFKYEYTIAHSSDKNYNKFFDADTGKLSARKMNDFKYNLLNDPVYAAGMKSIETGFDEIWTRPDLAFLRDMKNADGKPLFKKGSYDGFKVTMARTPDRSRSDSIKLASGGLGQDMANTQSSLLPQITQEQAEALVSAFSDRYGRLDLGASFGLANLSAEEYNDYGVPLNMLDNPVLQSRVLAQEFQRATDLLGNERKAVYALAGGTMADENGNIKSWAEIKQDKDAFTKTWFISPNENEQDREQANILLAQYQQELRKIRGY